MKKYKYVDSEVFTKTSEKESKEATSWWPRVVLVIVAILAVMAVIITALIVLGGARGNNTTTPMTLVAPASEPVVEVAAMPWLETLEVSRIPEGILVSFRVGPDFPAGREIVAVCENGSESGFFYPDQEGEYALLIEDANIASRAAVISGSDVHGGWIQIQ